MLMHNQTWSSKSYNENAGFVSDLGTVVLDLLKPRAGMRVLDLGCGDGALSQKITASGAELLGVDTSEDFLATARKSGLDVCLMSGEALEFENEFDAVFSNAALHWMRDQQSVSAGVARALKSGGRYVGEFGGHGNVAAIITALRAVARKYGVGDELSHPWYYPTASEHAALLERHGFEIEQIALIPRPTILPTGMKGWLNTFRKPFFDQFVRSERKKIMDEVCELLRWSLCDKNGKWTADYVRLRFAARLKQDML